MLKKKGWKGFFCCLPAILFIGIMFFYPVFDVVRISLYESSLFQEEVSFVGLKHYKTILQDRRFLSALKNTFYFASFSVFFHLLLGLIFASLLNQKIKFRTAGRVLHFFPWLVPQAVAAVLWLLMYQPLIGLYAQIPSWLKVIDPKPGWLSNTSTVMIAIGITNVWKFFPFFSLNLLEGMQVIPDELYEAEAIDGASSWYRFLYITIPHLKPVILTICMFDGVWCFSKTFDLVWLMTEGGPAGTSEILTTYIYEKAFWGESIEYAAAISVVMTLLLMGFVVIYIRTIAKK
ncbi:MAG: hypothetical protein CEE43_07410 [Promethearchaeota archaeon Loki_b32]|nr:MAG: hypothetical protein CEE43_07410 [Candidatus Lokiarchaeota archaeon Loki_b32]